MSKFVLFAIATVAVIASTNACDLTCRNFVSDMICQVVGCQGKLLPLCKKSCTGCTPCPIVPAQTCHTCKDLLSGCSNLDETSCNRHTKVGPLKNLCKASCGVCTPCDAIVTEEEEEETMTTVAPTTPPCASVEVCYDDNDADICEQNKGLCNLPQYQLFTDRCRRTCDLCSVCELPPNQTTLQCAECQDLRHECNKWSNEGYCSDNSPYPKVRDFCPKSCGLCEPAECNGPK